MGTGRPFAAYSWPRLLNSYFVHKSCSYPWLVKIAPSVLKCMERTPLKFLATSFVKKTFYRQFCGGETTDEVEKTMHFLKASKFNVILDFAAETGEFQDCKQLSPVTIMHSLNSSLGLASREEFKGTRLALKLSAFFPYQSLLDISLHITKLEKYCWEFKPSDIQKVFPEFLNQWNTLTAFVSDCRAGDVTVMIDAERIETQPAIDFMAIKLMETFNHDKVFVQNTYQMYLCKALKRMRDHYEYSRKGSFQFGAKIVRGAYLESDANICLPQNYGPIFKNISETHAQYNLAVNEVISEWMKSTGHSVDLVIATHNKNSLEQAASAIAQRELGSHIVSTAQLYGMQDDLTLYAYNLGLNAFKYVPYGPVDLTVSYLIRRAQENSDVLRNSGELGTITQEIMKRLPTL